MRGAMIEPLISLMEQDGLLKVQAAAQALDELEVTAGSLSPRSLDREA